MLGIDLSLAKAQHELWNVKLSFFIEGEDEELPAASLVDYRSCYFGKWLYSKGLSEYGSLPEMETLEKVHQELHAAAKQVVELKLAGNVAAAKEEIIKLEPISQQIISLMKSIEAKIKSAKG